MPGHLNGNQWSQSLDTLGLRKHNDWNHGIFCQDSMNPSRWIEGPTCTTIRNGWKLFRNKIHIKADKAAGIMWLMVESVHFRRIKDNALKMWGVLEGVHMQKQPGTHFNAYDDLFSIRKRDEDLLELPTGNRADWSLRYANALCCLVSISVYSFSLYYINLTSSFCGFSHAY